MGACPYDLGMMPTPPSPCLPSRRHALQHGLVVAGLLASTGLFPGAAWASYDSRAFEAKGLDATLKALALALPAESREVTLQGPDIAENGAQVALTVATTLPGVKRMLVLVEKNPAALAALFEVSNEIEPNFMLRVKMAETSAVFAVAVLDNGQVLYTRKDIQVTAGGCAF